MADYKTIPITRVRPVEEYFVITWQMDTRCNFDCMYCPSSFHDLHSDTKTLGQLQSAWAKIFNSSSNKKLKYKINFTGGEVTINKDFIPFLNWLHQNYQQYIAQIGVSSNGSASIDYYLNLLELVDFISFSTHTEFFNEKKFFNNVLVCSEKIKGTNKTVHVNIMDEFWAKEQIQKYANFLSKKNINYSVTEIDYSYKIRDKEISNKNTNFFNFDDN